MKIMKSPVIKNILIITLLELYFVCCVFHLTATIGSTETRMFLWIVMFSLMLLFVLSYFFLFYKKIEIHQCYFLIGLVFGVIFLFIIPPYSTPDEEDHIYSAYYLSDKILGYEIPDDATLVVRKCELTPDLNPYITEDVYHSCINNIFMKSSKEDCELVPSDKGLQKHIWIYTLGAVGISIGRVFSWGPIASLLLGTFLNALLFVIVSAYAIKKMPFCKVLLCGICLLPMTLQQVNSLSYDNLLFSAFILIFALGSRWMYCQEKRSKTEIACYIGATIVLLAVKGGAYFVLCLIPFFYKMWTEKGEAIFNRHKKLWIGIIAILFVLFCGIMIFCDYMNFPVVSETAVISWTNEPAYSIAGFLSHPKNLLHILIRSYTDYSDWYLKTALSGPMGWFDIELPEKINIIYCLLLLLSVLKVEGDDLYITGKARACYIGASAICISLVAAAMLVYWTPAGAGKILGLQGRYFIMIIPFLLLCIRNNILVIKRNIDRFILLAMVFMGIDSIYYIFQTVIYKG